MADHAEKDDRDTPAASELPSSESKLPGWFNREPVTDSTEIPLARAGLPSRLAFWWVAPLMSLGYKRALEPSDIWKMDASRETAPHAARFDACLLRRQKEFDYRKNGVESPGMLRRAVWAARAGVRRNRAEKTYAQRRAELETEWREDDLSVVWAIFDVFPMLWWVWPWCLIGGVAMVTAPLVIKELIKFSQQSEW
jgi:hypothetical protein